MNSLASKIIKLLPPTSLTNLEDKLMGIFVQISLNQSVAAHHCQVPEFQLRVSKVFFLGLLVLPNNVGIGDSDLEIDGIGDRIMRLPCPRRTLIAVRLHPGL